MEPRAAIVLVAFAALFVFAIASAVLFWRNGQARPTWQEWRAKLRKGSAWHLAAALAGVVFLASLILMRISGAPA